VEIKNRNFNCNAFLDWGVTRHGVPQGSILGPSHFLHYVNDISKAIRGNSKPILFVNDTSIIFTNFGGIDIDIFVNCNWVDTRWQ
jgi:hypothetical protein